MCALDVRPFDIVEGDGFQAFAQALINLGARMNKVDAGELLHHPISISRHVRAMFPEAEESMKRDIESASSPCVEVSFDLKKTRILHSTI